MQLLETDNITGFASCDKEIKILDMRGEPFYFMQNPTGKKITFNMPSGIFETCNELEELEKPLIYLFPKLPEREKNIPIVPALDITIGDNPNKCSISVATGHIFMDYSIDDKPIPFKNFILNHELGHFYFKTEWKCDVFAAKKMLDLGYNPSQCYYSNAICLSEKNIERKKILYRFLTQIKIK